MGAPVGWIYWVALRSLRRAQCRTAMRRSRLRRDPSAVLPASARKVWDLVHVLPVRERTIVVLRDVPQFSESDIALAMGIRRTTVAAALDDAHRALGDRVEPDPSTWTT